jgi:ribosomal protein L40E
MNTSGIGSYEEHTFSKVIPGNVEQVRQRLIDALEAFNYLVIGENPLQAKRATKSNVMTANVLEYDARLTIGLKTISPASTLATFDYAVEYIFSKGERLALEREADALIALVTAPLNKSVCPACASENPGAVRFCRACGTPMMRSNLPAEFEVLRLMGGTSAAEIEIGWGVSLVIFTLMLTLPMILLGKPKLVNVGWVLFIIGELLGMITLAYGMRRLHKTVNPVAPSQMLGDRSRPMPAPESLPFEPPRPALPPQPVSITEGTTELIEQQQAAPVQVKQARTTDAMES